MIAPTLRRPTGQGALNTTAGNTHMKLENSDGAILWQVDDRGVAQVILNRPEVNNAYDGALIEGLVAALDALAAAPGLRAVVIRGNGRHFQAGADLKWMEGVRRSSPEENVRVSRMTRTGGA